MLDKAMVTIDDAINNCHAPDEDGFMVDALRAVEASDEDTRRMAIQRIEDVVKQGKASRGLVNLLITLRRVA